MTYYSLRKKTFILLSAIFILSVIFVSSALSKEKKSPFEARFPIKVEEPEQEVVVEQPVIEEPVARFDVSIYKLNGLIWGASKPQAIINNEIYGTGDKLGEAEITKIDKNGVTLLFDKKEYTISPERKIKIIEEK